MSSVQPTSNRKTTTTSFSNDAKNFDGKNMNSGGSGSSGARRGNVPQHSVPLAKKQPEVDVKCGDNDYGGIEKGIFNTRTTSTTTTTKNNSPFFRNQGKGSDNRWSDDIYDTHSSNKSRRTESGVGYPNSRHAVIEEQQQIHYQNTNNLENYVGASPLFYNAFTRAAELAPSKGAYGMPATRRIQGTRSVSPMLHLNYKDDRTIQDEFATMYREKIGVDPYRSYEPVGGIISFATQNNGRREDGSISIECGDDTHYGVEYDLSQNFPTAQNSYEKVMMSQGARNYFGQAGGLGNTQSYTKQTMQAIAIVAESGPDFMQGLRLDSVKS